MDYEIFIGQSYNKNNDLDRENYLYSFVNINKNQKVIIYGDFKKENKVSGINPYNHLNIWNDYKKVDLIDFLLISKLTIEEFIYEIKYEIDRRKRFEDFKNLEILEDLLLCFENL